MCPLAAQELDNHILADQATQHMFYALNGVFTYLKETNSETLDGLFPSYDELDALLATQSLSLIDVDHIAEAPSTPS